MYSCLFRINCISLQNEFMAKNDWNESEIVINLGYKPALRSLQKISAEGTLYLGMPDKEGPSIRIGENQ